MMLQAVTVWVNDADLLECMVENRQHFDRWVIVTSREDERRKVSGCNS